MRWWRPDDEPDTAVSSNDAYRDGLLPGCVTFDARELVTRRHEASEALTKIAMGSCLRENRKQPVWKAILIAKPDLFVHLGDNVYADTYLAAQMHSNCARLWSHADYQALRRAVPVIAIWKTMTTSGPIRAPNSR